MGSKRVLVVDDEDAIREVVQAALEIVGDYDVITAASGSEGFHTATAERPDAILLDVMMPDMDGIAVFQRLQEEPSVRGIPVILLTAKAQPSDRRRFTDLGVAGVIVKPFDPMGLPEEMAAILGWNSG